MNTCGIWLTTRLNPRIHRKYGGGEDRVHKIWSINAPNLLRAIAELKEHRRTMLERHGNVGCGQSWLDIAGVNVDDGLLTAIHEQMDSEAGKRQAAALIKQVRSGSLASAPISVAGPLDDDVGNHVDTFSAIIALRKADLIHAATEYSAADWQQQVLCVSPNGAVSSRPVAQIPFGWAPVTTLAAFRADGRANVCTCRAGCLVNLRYLD